MFGGYDYEPGDTFLSEESFDDYYGDEIEDRVIYAMEPESEPIVQQLTLWGAY